MEGNFLSRYNNKIECWMKSIEDDPKNKRTYETDMARYIGKCMPYIQQYINTDNVNEVKTDNVFNCKETTGLQKKDIYTDYLINVEKKTMDRPIERVVTDQCPNCPNSNVFHFRNTSELVCDACGIIIDVLISDELTYKEEQETSGKIINYSYKRDNHFNEWLSQFQAQEMTTIPKEVIEELRNEFKKIKIKVLTEITHAKVRALLKKLKLNKYYEHVPYITNILSGISPPKMPIELEEQLRMMFKDIQKPFDNNCPSDRKNFLSYSYVLYKFCELLSEDTYLQYFPLLKSKEKLHQQDIIWKKICGDLHWEYIKTI
jgi:ribosomal protein S27E|tara:strand:- start:416 stop:1366 length:951 start_codon:yes stop_codon:yes gene_type:complete